MSCMWTECNACGQIMTIGGTLRHLSVSSRDVIKLRNRCVSFRKKHIVFDREALQKISSSFLEHCFVPKDLESYRKFHILMFLALTERCVKVSQVIKVSQIWQQNVRQRQRSSTRAISCPESFSSRSPRTHRAWSRRICAPDHSRGYPRIWPSRSFAEQNT